MDKKTEELVASFLEGELDEEGTQRLAGRLETHDEDREEFLDLASQARAMEVLFAPARDLSVSVLNELYARKNGSRFVGEVLERLPKPHHWWRRTTVPIRSKIMRKDVKIGIAVGLLVAIVGSVYFFIASSKDDPTAVVDTSGPDQKEPGIVTLVDPPVPEPISTDPPVPEPISTDPPVTNLPLTETLTDRGTEADRTTVSPGTIEIRGVGDGDEPLGDPTLTSGDRSLVGGDVDNTLVVVGSDRTPTMETLDDSDRTGDTDTVISPVTSVSLDTPRSLRPDPISSDVDVRDSTAPAAGNFYSNAARTYIVQYGDNGFWTVAARMYGDGKYFGVIADANPNVDSSSLRPHQKLRVPPLPQKYRRKPVKPTPTVGLIGTQRTYVVKKGDAGFWGVSVKVYGHGKYYREIAKANPGVNSSTLRDGQRLIIPPKPSDPSRPGAGDTGVGVTPTDLPVGYQVYVVRRGDAGFWDVAVKMYGNGKHFDLVAQANPGVDSRRLQEGQKLRIPPVGEARRLTSAATAPTIEEAPREISPTGADPRPIFD